MKINTGQGTISIMRLIAILSISLTVNLPGLAISPMLGNLQKIFPDTSELKTQLIMILPNLLIIPFVLLSGKLSILRDKIGILIVALLIYLSSGIACFFVHTMTQLIVLSCLLGIGCGLIIPLSAGLLSDFFTGKYLMKQLGIKSGIANIALVVATLGVGAMSKKDWHLSFLVYLMPIIPLLLTPFLFKKPAFLTNRKNILLIGEIDIFKIIGIAFTYGFITYAIVVFSYYLPFVAGRYGVSNDDLGIITSLFFLSIMMPGFVLPRIIYIFKQYTNVISLLWISIGLFLIVLFHHPLMWGIAAVFSGLGYGVMQPIIYDKATQTATGRKVTLALSVVFAMNYVAVSLAPFIVNIFEKIFHIQSNKFPFLLNGILVLVFMIIALFYKKSFTIRINKEYCKS
ncbi:MAG: MFS transporter [Chitinophagaceae bacterium]